MRIPEALYSQLIDHCRREYPREACGILGGESGVVKYVYPMANINRSSISYQMDPKEQLCIMKQMRQENCDMVAIYHSHTTTEAFPSVLDVELAISADVFYLIVSLKDKGSPIMRSYRVEDGQIKEESLCIC